MDDRRLRFRIGAMVLASLLVTAILLIMFGETRTIFQPTYTIKIAFHDAPGVSDGAPIRRNGIVVGKVTDVALLPEGGVLVTAQIQEAVKLRHSDVCRITSTLLGDSMLNFVQTDRPHAQAGIVQPGETLQGAVAPDAATLMVDMQERLSVTIESVARTSEDFGGVVRKVGTLLDTNEQRINSVMAKADNTLTLLNQTAGHANDVVGDPQMRKDLQATLEQFPQVLRDVRGTLANINQTVVLMDRNLEHIEDFTRPLGERGEVLVNRLNQSIEKLDLVMEQMVTFTQGLNSQQGTLGQLIHNRELYDNLNRTVLNVEDLTRQLQPVVRDARVFSDKIARHPETLGVRGAIERSPGTKGVPVLGPLR